MKEKLLEYLFRNDAYTYAVLDGASVPDLPNRLYETDPPNFCLYRGELPDDLVYVAPYLVLLEPETPFTEWLLDECWGKHWGIFAQTPTSLTGMRKHFRSILTVQDETGKPFLFRFYDPRVLPSFLLTCQYDELEKIFGSVKYFFVEMPETNDFLRFHLTKGKLKETRLKLDEQV